jgi:hypothetical protein
MYKNPEMLQGTITSAICENESKASSGDVLKLKKASKMRSVNPMLIIPVVKPWINTDQLII